MHTGYRRYRPEMLALGVELYELSPIRVNRSLRLGRFGTSTGRLHAKSAVIDGERLFIGSMNFDPRSDRHNTELGLFIESPQLAQQTLKLIDAIMQQGTYRVRIADNGTTLRVGGDRRARRGNPGRGAGGRLLDADDARGLLVAGARGPALTAGASSGAGATRGTASPTVTAS